MRQIDLSSYDAFWAEFFGIEPERLREESMLVVKHARLGAYSGIWFFTREASRIVSAPEAWVEPLRARSGEIAAAGLPGPELLRDLIGGDPERVIGPTYQGSLVSGAFRGVRDARVRRLQAADDEAVAALRAACSELDWDHSGLSGASEPRFGSFADGQLVAMGGLEGWSVDIANPGVLCHPAHRRRGHATAIVSAVVERAIADGKLMLYQTLLANEASVAIATRLGFAQYASHLAVRLQAPPA
jgi:GNAT superfamily N-acetyltransferase